ncbi:hypothetical protein KUTeg_014177 [Tegillarca granosa]|uniref:Uncharacterized protein n=1 Tax=Tegillarca granosa TaxID=220873 RepID=A0ABQ9EVW2_TEGGR|nr:hypothetical protein KUTeg_014177 [Tegillarca granosa]
MFRQKITIYVSATGIVLTLAASTILTPLWIDAIGSSNHTKNSTYTSENSTINVTYQRVDSFCIVFIVNVLYTVLSFLLLLLNQLLIFIKDSTKQKTHSCCRYTCSDIFVFFCIGSSDAVASILFVYASGGSRTAPYLQLILIKKRPTCRKVFFACLVMIAEFVSLIPKIFSLESKQSMTEDGGATGVWGIIWPVLYFLGFIPLSAVSVCIEKSAKTKYQSFKSGDFLFNIECFFGIDHCVINVHIYSGLCIISMLLNRLFTIIFLRVAEGANYLSIIMALQTPIVIMFWSLCDEQPFQWHPHMSLPIILSIVAVCIILPSIYFYSTELYNIAII